MVKIRLTRTGKRHEPHYRIVAVDSRRPRDGKYIEKIGYYNPRTKPPTLQYDKAILTKWIDCGAQMTDTVHDIFVRDGAIKQTPKRKHRIKRIIESSKSKKSEPEKKEGSKKDIPTTKPAKTEGNHKTEADK